MNVKLLANASTPWEFWTRRWGLSMIVDNTTLFDTFSSYRILAKKMKRYQVDLNQITSVVISHEHWDHLNGLWGLLKKKQGLNVYLPSHADEDIKARIIKNGSILKANAGTRKINASMQVTGDLIGAFNGRPVAEQTLALETANGIVLLVGCGHPGIGAIIKKARQSFRKPVYGIVGGLHLKDKTQLELMHEALALKEQGITLIAPLHCSGRKAHKVLKNVFREGYIDMKEGDELMLV